jgi:6-phosphogluconolactonase/glucosamine-6-phosphate isomerase/deaminase
MPDSSLIKELIISFQTAKELNQALADHLINEFTKPGLILLPTGKTFEQGVYPLVDKYFADKFEEDFQKKLQNKSYTAPEHLSAGLKLSHLDELLNPQNPEKLFAKTLKRALPTAFKSLGERFFAIDPEDPEAFDKFVKSCGGPRLIYCGIGSDPSRVHVAYIGEEYINSATTVIQLSPKLAELTTAEHAITVGTDIFDYAGLESVIVSAKGASKAESLKAAFKDPDTGLGWLIGHHPKKIKIYCDNEALAFIK